MADTTGIRWSYEDKSLSSGMSGIVFSEADKSLTDIKEVYFSDENRQLKQIWAKAPPGPSYINIKAMADSNRMNNRQFIKFVAKDTTISSIEYLSIEDVNNDGSSKILILDSNYSAVTSHIQCTFVLQEKYDDEDGYKRTDGSSDIYYRKYSCDISGLTIGSTYYILTDRYYQGSITFLGYDDTSKSSEGFYCNLDDWQVDNPQSYFSPVPAGNRTNFTDIKPLFKINGVEI